MKRLLFFLIVILFGTSSCVSKKELQKASSRYDELAVQLDNAKNALDVCNLEKEKIRTANEEKIRQLERDLDLKNTELNNAKTQVARLEQEVEYLRGTNTNLLSRLQDLSVVNQAGAESIKKSLEALNTQTKYVQDLNNRVQARDSVNLSLVMNLKRSLADVNDEDIQVEVKKGVVFISISDKLLFTSGSHDVTKEAEVVLGKVAKVVNDHKDLDILIEGHTDNVPISNSCIKDNWDLSVKRATSIVRVLQWKYGVLPQRMTAGGRSEYLPKEDNATKEGKKINRRTEIIITPKLEQFFDLLSPQNK